MPEMKLDSFAGGVKDGFASTDFSERQWSVLSGVMFEPDGRLRSQWGAETVGGGGWDGVLVADGLAVGVRAGRVVAFETDAPTVVDVGDYGPVRPLTVVPWLVDGAWTSAVLLGAVDLAATAVLVYRGGTGPVAHTFADRFPSGTPSTDAMPYAQVGGTWGDYLLVGDVRWAADESLALSSTNQTRRSNGVWLSNPAKVDEWDPIDLLWAGNADVENVVVGMFPLEMGLVVLTTAGVFLFRGTAVDSEYEELRLGIGPAAPEHVTYWPAAGAVVWTDGRGQVWHTNGQEFGRLDRPLPAASAGGPVTAVGDHVLAVRDGRLWAFHLAGEDGAWSELMLPGLVGPPTSMVTSGGSVFVADGTSLWRLAPGLPRGQFDAELLPVTVVTPTLSTGDAHRRTSWHRFGVRLAGPGRLVGARALPRPWAASAPVGEVAYGTATVGADRQGHVWPAHGPSSEATFAFEGEGDLTVEGVTVWFHTGRSER